MITTIRNRHYYRAPWATPNHLINSLIQSRNLFNIQTIDYDLITVTSLDLDEDQLFLLVGQSNGGIDLLEVNNSKTGSLNTVSRLNISHFSLNRVQWSPSKEQFFSLLDNHDLYLIDPAEMRAIEKFEFNLKTNWSEWNINDSRSIAVCGSESQVRFVDIRTGSSVQTVILGAPSRLSSHQATRCLWSNLDTNCLIVGDNEGYLHLYDIRYSSRSLTLSGCERGPISGMAFTQNDNTILTTQGTENRLVEWSYQRGKLKPDDTKFQKREKMQPDQGQSSQAKPGSKKPPTQSRALKINRESQRRSNGSLAPCQFHVTDRHVFCPVSSRTKKSKEIYIYDVNNGERLKTLKSDGIMSQGVYSVTSMLPNSLVLFIGGRGRLRVWTIDEDNQRKTEERLRRYRQTRWDSDDES